MARRARVLLAISDGWLRVVTAATLRGAGFSVLPAANGFEAWERFRDARGDVDLVVAETRLPGLEGIGLVRGLRAVAGGLGALLVDGDPAAGEPAALRRERVGFVRLPVPLAELAVRAEAELRRPDPAAPELRYAVA
jgi:DNA-binding response OmpR family regulator